MDPFVSEIRMYPYTFPPKAWAFCDGQLLPLSQNTALFSLVGTVYGGDGKSTFALPDLQGRHPMHPSNGTNGTSTHFLGETGGSETVTLLQSEIPAHTHALRAYNDVGEDRIPGPTEALARSTGGLLYAAPGALTTMAPQDIGVTGGDAPHNNLQPYLVVHFCIALQGVFPPRP